MAMKYNTNEKRLKFLSPGNIITFKTPQRGDYCNGTNWTQVIVSKLAKKKEAGIVYFRLEGIAFGRDSDWYKSMKDLISAVNWKHMETMHSDQ